MNLRPHLASITLLCQLSAAIAGPLPVAPVRDDLPEADLRIGIPLLDRSSVLRDRERDAADMELVKQRLRTLYLQEAAPNMERVTEWLATLQADGSWPEFDYQTLHRQFFPPFEHLRRVGGMALAYLHDTPLRGEPRLFDAVVRAIGFWLDANPQTQHLWFVEIGVPLFLVKPLVLLEHQLDPALIQRAMPQLTRAVMADEYVYNGAPATGANLTWIARAAMEAALLVGDVP